MRTDSICSELRNIGFSCTGCADCCKDIDNNLETILVGPEEIRLILSFTGLKWDDIVIPYPEFISIPGSGPITFGWSLRRKNKACIFLVNNRCSIYKVRPRICSTYPFMLEEENLLTFPCNGLRYPLNEKDAIDIAERLKNRFYKEIEEDRKMKEYYSMKTVQNKKLCIIDAEGIKERELWLS